MVNAWSLLYDEYYGTMNETFPVKTNEPDDNIVVSTGSTASMGDFVSFNIDDKIENITIDTGNENIDFANIELPDGMSINQEYVSGVYDDTWPHAQNFLADNDDNAAHHFSTPKPGIESDNPRKYKEDESIKALQEYISTTYSGHYTSKENNVQTLDLIESVGDAESFCRSNAIKYLSRYDKKGQAKRDILKALHYSLLLYHFSGQNNETQTCGYETF